MSKYDRRRRNKKEESSDEESSSSEESWETEDEESETVTESSSEETESESEESEETESESESDSSYVPKKRSSRRLKRRSSDDEEENISRKEVQKIISRLFPSKYMNERVKEKSSRRQRKNKKDRKKKQKEMSDSDEEYEEYMRSIEEEDDDDDNGGRINIILGIGNGDADDELVEDDNEECDSDDEKTFMKESYQSLELPKEMKQVKELEKKSRKSKKNKTKDSEESDDIENKFESEYSDLVDMKKYLTTKLHEKPNSKTLIRSLNETKDAIKKLVKKTRDRNTKNYHKLISSHKQKMTNEMEYFKKKLSHKEQLKIMSDLKEVNEQIQVNIPYRVALLDSQVPNKYKAAVMQKLNILKSMEPSDSEYYKIKNWVDAFMKIPFGKYKELDIKMENGIEQCSEFMEKSMEILDECVYGLNDAKMQILQMIGQWISNPSALGTAIAIKGPPGTGKTSLIKEGISKILGREFAFIALGGASDSSFLEGHSYTYEGSLWGKIVQILMEAKSMNPVIYFDELDKVSDTPKGEEIIGILTHLTDTSQNSSFHDKYFADVDFDLSKCLFIFSYNDESKVNPILKDRMYRIQTKGYNPKEKITIANNYLLPKLREQVNFSTEDVIIPDETIEYIVSNSGLTANEEGVRNLKRCLEVIHTKLNLFRLVKPDNAKITKEIALKVEFPFTVKKSDVDILIKNDEKQNQSLLAMYI